MKINGMNHANGIHSYKKAVEKLHGAQGAKRRDQLEISSEAKQLQQKSQYAAERQEKIDAIKKKVDTGQYSVDAQKVAKKFYEFWMDR